MRLEAPVRLLLQLLVELIYKLVCSLKLKYLLKDTLLQTSELCDLSRRVIQFATAQIHSTEKQICFFFNSCMHISFLYRFSTYNRFNLKLLFLGKKFNFGILSSHLSVSYKLLPYNLFIFVSFNTPRH